ncbi:MAG: LptF/LptG family permease [Planctomycetota bacterium]
MWKLHRLYLRELTLTLIPTLIVLFGIVLLASAARGVQQAEGSTLYMALKVTVFWALDALVHLLGIGFLLATCATFARAGSTRELTAVQAAGVSLRVPLQSALLVGTLLSVVMAFVLHEVAPATHFGKHRVLAESVRVVLMRSGLKGDVLSVGDTVTLTWERQDGGFFEDLVLFLGEDADFPAQIGADSGVLVADRARFRVSPDGESLLCDLEGLRDAVREQPFLEFFQIRQPLDSLSVGSRREGDRDLASDQLVAELSRGVHPLAISARYTLNRRISFALLPLLLAPIGFALGVLARDRGRAVALSLCAVPLGLFYAADFLGLRLTQATDQALFAFCPVLACALFWFYPCGRILRR